MIKSFRLAVFIFLALPLAYAGTITGTLATANGVPVKNGILTFTPTQLGLIAGTGMQVPTSVTCATSTDGSIVGLANPLTFPALTKNQSVGTLPAGTYFVVFALYNASGTTLVSPEAQITLTAPGTLIFTPPTLPSSATGWRVFIGTATGTETLQGSLSFGQFQQSTSLIAGTALPVTNSTACTLNFNDTIIPTGTGYNVALHTPTGQSYPGFPMVWQLTGATVNVSSGLPLYTGTVLFPSPILASPLNHGQQSISGPLDLGGYNLTGVSIPVITGNVQIAGNLDLAGNSLNNAKIAQLPDSVKSYGAKGDGVTDDTAAIQAAFTADAPIGRDLHFPCGTYITSAMLTYLTPVSAGTGIITGETRPCVTIQYTGTTAIEAVVKVWPGSINSVYSFNFGMSNIDVVGNTRATYTVELEQQSHIVIDRLRMWGADTSVGACLYVYNLVAGVFTQPACDVLFSGAIPASKNGLVFDGQNSGNQTTTSQIINPLVEGLSNGIGIWLKMASQMVFSACQLSGDNQSLKDESASSSNQFTGCLFENETVGSDIEGAQNTIDDSTFSSITGTPGITIGGDQNILRNSYVGNGPIHITATAKHTRLEQIKLNDTAGDHGVSDLGVGTVQVATTYSNTAFNNRYPQSVDATDVASGMGLGTNTPQTLRGTWQFTNSYSTILSNSVFTTGKSWKALFIGKFTSLTLPVSTAVPSITEITETANTVVDPTSNVLTFSVNGSGFFQGVSASTSEVFTGTIIFIPDITATTTGASVFVKTPNAIDAGSYKILGAAASVAIPASLTTTAASSDVLTVTGMTASGHCANVPTNASAATNYTSTYVSAKTTNQITVTHPATSGMTFDFLCTPN